MLPFLWEKFKLLILFGIICTSIIIVIILTVKIKNDTKNNDLYPLLSDEYGRFPKKFLFGASTSAYQIEGAWNKDGKGANIWDVVIQNDSQFVEDNTNASIAANSYELYEEDIKALKQMEINSYRFSISWSRILPNGDLSSKNELGLQYYDKLINSLLSNGIEPLVTIYHFDLPQAIQNFGGWTNSTIIDYFVQYARVLFDRYGDRINFWFTINEPSIFCGMGYGDGSHAPRVQSPGVGEYLCMHHALLAHARVYRMYKKVFNYENSKVGIVIHSRHYFPNDPNKKEDIEASTRALNFSVGWLLHPIYSGTGDYPKNVREIIDRNSKIEGFNSSRLPSFTNEEKQILNGSSDFIGINYYTARYVEPGKYGTYPIPSFKNDQNITEKISLKWPIENTSWLFCVPQGLTMLLRWIKEQYYNPLIFITENGWADYGEISDKGRINYLTVHLQAVLDAIWEDQIPIIGYTHWSLLDNFEWANGYTQKFGLYKIDYNSTNRTRIPKESSEVYRSIIRSRQIYF